MPVQKLELLPRLLKALDQVLLRDFADILSLATFDLDLVELAAKMLDTCLEVQEHLLDFVISLACLFVLRLGLS